MSVRKTDRANIDKYLKGKLDDRAMHELERAAQSDPFLMDAMDGFVAASTNQDTNLADLQSRLAERVAPKKDRVILLWRVLPIAASLLLIIGGGYWFFKPDARKPQYANEIEPKKVDKKPDTTQAVGEQAKIISPSIAQKATPTIRKTIPKPNTQNTATEEATKPTDAADLIAQTKPVAKLNGKDFSGGNVQQAAKNLPADILEKIQVVDDYSAQAKKSDITTNKFALKGTIIDATTKEPLPGTTVGVPGKGLTQTDVNGNYTLMVDQGTTLVFNQAGYTPLSVKLKPGQKTLDIHLNTTNNALTETVVRGYVKRDKEQTIGSSYVITGKEVQNVPVGNVEQLLQGKVPGLAIQNNKGQAGMRGTVNVRGLAASPITPADSAIAKNMGHLKTINGQVTDKDGLPIPEVIVGTIGKSLAHTDANGNYQVVIDTASTLIFNQLGYVVQSVKVKPGQATINVNLKTANNTLAEVNIRGYVKRTREETTGSSYIITGKDQRKATEHIPIGKIPGKFLPVNPPVSKNKTEVKCNENETFKDQFFSDIVIIERYMLEKEQGSAKTVSYDQFFDALRFIVKRVPAAIKPNKKTQAAYADTKAFRSDRDKWLEWYENNKCKGLK